MRIRISGPGIGPVHTTLWSSRSRGGSANGCGGIALAVISLPFLVVALGSQFLHWQFAVAAGVIVALIAGGRYAQVRAVSAKVRAAQKGVFEVACGQHGPMRYAPSRAVWKCRIGCGSRLSGEDVTAAVNGMPPGTKMPVRITAR